MTDNIITLVRGDDSNFLNETLLFINFTTEDFSLDGFKAFLTIENSHNYTKKYDIVDGSIEIILNKSISSTLEVGIHRCSVKLIDTLGRIRTVKNFNIKVVDEFNVDSIQYSEHIIDIGFSSKDYNMLFNKPSINGVELTGNKSLEELGIQPVGNYSTVEYVDTLTENINSEIDFLELKVNKKADIDYMEELLDRKSDKADTYTKVEVNTLIDDINDSKQDKLTAGENITIDKNNVISVIPDGVTSINGQTGEVELTAEDVGALPDTTVIPDISNLATKDEIPDLTQYTKKTDYAGIDGSAGLIRTSSTYGTQMVTSGYIRAGVDTLEPYNTRGVNFFIGKGTLENIKDDYVKRGLTENALEFTDDEKTNARTLIGAIGDTDYATGTVGGVVKVTGNHGLAVYQGMLIGSAKTFDSYSASANNLVMTKGTLENVKDDFVKRGVTTNTIALTAGEKASVKAWLGYADSTDIMTAIAAIPQFSLSIVEALPETGAKMTLYLVPKEGSNNDVYDEYIWIEQTSSFEHLGTTAVDLTDYVKKTDYITGSTAGVVRAGAYYGTTAFNGFLCCQTRTQEQYDAHDNTTVIGKGTLENIKNDVVKRAVTANDIELTDDEKASARTWLGAIGTEDYASATTAGSAGIVKCSSTFACGCTNGYIQALNIPTLERYNNLSQYAFIGKATLQTALTEYSKTVLTTEADYNALETKDANTLYLIEE